MANLNSTIVNGKLSVSDSVSVGGVQVSSQNIKIRGTTTANPTQGQGAPGIEFINEDSTQHVTLAFDDYDSYKFPAGLTLSGNQGNEYLIAPRFIKTGASADDILLGDGSTITKSNLLPITPLTFRVGTDYNRGSKGYQFLLGKWEDIGMFVDLDFLIALNNNYGGKQRALVEVAWRQNNVKPNCQIDGHLTLIAGELSPFQLKLFVNNTTGEVQLWCNTTQQWCFISGVVLSVQHRTAPLQFLPGDRLGFEYREYTADEESSYPSGSDWKSYELEDKSQPQVFDLR